MAADVPILFVPVGSNDARAFGMLARDRACRLAANAGFECGDRPEPGRAALIASLAYAYDQAWLTAMAKRPRALLTLNGKVVMAHVPEDGDPELVIDVLQSGRTVAGYGQLDAETAKISYYGSGKRDRPFVLPFDAVHPEPVERAAYDAACKGVTDLLTLYLWRRPAFSLTRWAARSGLSPNFVTCVGAFFCVLAFLLFWRAQYWWGLLASFIFMVLDTVAGKLARVTVTSSKWGGHARSRH